MASTSKKDKKMQHSRHNMLWAPKRCNVEGCDDRSLALSKCGGCGCVFYCSREHQKQDWKIHKSECKAVAAKGMWGRGYTTEDSFERIPLMTRENISARVASPIPADASCAICGRSASSVRLGRARCCGMIGCDTEDEYVMFSYSKEHCLRSHHRYTVCGYHNEEGHGPEKGLADDWRVCEGDGEPCMHGVSATGNRVMASSFFGVEVPVDYWYALNAYNEVPVPTERVPKGRLFQRCGRCNIPLIHEGFQVTRTHGRVCQACGSR
eukprot:TRINITY_DN13966_c0_g1_i1.p1 TRINITY_DN13966_c0_g1~~TRINITY_DN13966_c0_g1_i1.p1  ORF type:complete len:266 (+),score=62.95 TRINITY_DN13966_c0_g1_i1:82-879(+)